MSIIQEMPQKIHSGSNRYFFWLDLILLFLLAGYVLSGINLVPFHGDEATFIVMSEDYDRIVKHRDVSRVLFNAEGSLKQNTRLSTGSILALSIGFARDITDTEESTSRWLWGASWDENISQGNMPDPEILRLARAFPAAMGALSIVLFFFTTLYLFPSRLFAWVTTLTFVTHGDVLMSFRRAIQEGPKFFFLILTLYMASHMLKDLQNRNIRRYPYIFLGLASGLTLAAKQDTAPVLLAIFIALSLIPIWKRDPLRIKLINMVFLGTSAILALSCFLLLMPVFWSWWESALALIGLVIILFQLPLWKTDQAARPLALAGCLLVLAMTVASPTQWRTFLTPMTSMIEIRGIIIESQIEFLKRNNQPYLDTPEARMLFLLKTALTSKVMYMEAASFDVPAYHEHIAAYEDSLIEGRTGSPWADGFVLILAIIGGWWLLRYFNTQSLLIYSMLITSGIFLFATVPLPWQRYYLILQIPYALMAGAGASQLWVWGKKALNSQPIKTEPAPVSRSRFRMTNKAIT